MLRKPCFCVLRMLKPGDQIAVDGETSVFKYYHHGIFISFEEGVIDFGVEKEINLRKVDIMTFNDFGKRRLVKILHKDEDCLPPDTVVENAEKALKDPRSVGAFNIVYNNCVHFATKCKIGRGVSNEYLEMLRKAIVDLKLTEAYACIREQCTKGCGCYYDKCCSCCSSCCSLKFLTCK